MLLGLAYLDSKGATLGCICTLLRPAGFFCGLTHSFEENMMFSKCCHTKGCSPACPEILSECQEHPGTWVGTVPIPQLGC